MATNLDDAAKRWAQRSLAPTAQGPPKWEAEAQHVGNGVRTWSTNLADSLRRIGAQPGKAYLEQYVRHNVSAATAGRYGDGVRKAAGEDKWRKNFLGGVER